MADKQNLGQYEPAFQNLGIGFYTGEGAPTFTAAQGSLYVDKTAASTTTRLYINTDGSTTWAYFTASA
jgi:hypothetical protein